MFFGDFLVRKQLINKEDLIEALSEQLSSTPPLLKILHESGDFSPSDLIELVKEQVQSGLEIKTLILKKNIVSQDKLKDYLGKQNNSRMPLGQILIEMGKLSVDECQAALEEFIAEDKGLHIVDGEIDLDSISIDELTQDLESEASNAMALDESEDDKKEFAAYLEKEPETTEVELPEFVFEELETMVLPEYLEVFDEAKKDELDQSVLSWAKMVKAEDADGLKEALRIFYRELHTMKGTVRFLKGVVSEFTIHTAEDLLADLIVCAAKVDDKLVADLEDFYLNMIDLTWALRNFISDNNSEEGLYSDVSFNQNLQGFLGKSKIYKEKVDELLSSRSVEDVASQF